MSTGRLIGLDHGIKRIGIAISDGSRTLAREVMILTRKTRVEDFAAINALAVKEEATGFVIGMPSSDAPEGVHTQADTVKLWIERFRETISLPIVEWDEQLTSDDARDIARQHKRKYDAPIDDLAARLILQSFLNALHDDLATFP